MRKDSAIKIRPLGQHDYRSVKNLERIIVSEYLRFLKEARQQDDIEPWITQDYFNYYMRTKASFIAVVDGKVAGFILAQPTSYVHSAQREMWLEYIAVLPELRRKGIGSALISKVLDRARSEKVTVLHTALNPNNDESSKFLEKHGFEIKDWKSAMIRPNRKAASPEPTEVDK